MANPNSDTRPTAEDESSDEVGWELLDASPPHLHPKDGGQEQGDFSDGIRSDYFVLESHAAGSDGSRDVEDWPSDDSEHGRDGIVSEGVQEDEPEVVRIVSEGVVQEDEPEVVVESNDCKGCVEGDGADEGAEEVESDVVGSNECSSGEETVVLMGSDEAGEVVASDGDGGSMGSEDSVVDTNGEGEKRAVWWRMPIELIKFYALRVGPVWSLSIAAAVVGIVALARRLRRSKPKARLIPLKIRMEDKVMMLSSSFYGFFFLLAVFCIRFF